MASVPRVLPLRISFSLYRFQSNIRSATLFGIFGAGGVTPLVALPLIDGVTVPLFDGFIQLIRKVVVHGIDRIRFIAILDLIVGFSSRLNWSSPRLSPRPMTGQAAERRVQSGQGAA